VRGCRLSPPRLALSRPFWIDRVGALLPAAPAGLALGPLWHLRERLQLVREEIDEAALALDLQVNEGASELWARFEERERDVARALAAVGAARAAEHRKGVHPPEAFRAEWESLGFARHAEGAGTPADDLLDGLFALSRLDHFEAPAPHALLNLATRAERISDFLETIAPGRDELVVDLGSGSGKLALTVAASAQTQVRGIECEGRYVAHARRSAEGLGLRNVRFEEADVRDVDLDDGTHFYLFYPFRGPVARTIAARLGALARDKAISIYAAGPALSFGEHFLAEVAAGALTLRGRRGEFGEVLHLESRRD